MADYGRGRAWASKGSVGATGGLGFAVFMAAVGCAMAIGTGHPVFALLGLAFLAVTVSRWLFGSPFAPLGLHGSVWFCALGLTSLGLAPLWQNQWAQSTWVVVIAAECAFASGCVLALSVTRRKREGIAENERAFLHLLIATVVMFVLGAVAFAVQLRNVGGFGALVSDPVRARETFIMPGVGYAYALLYITPALSVAYRARARRFRGVALSVAILSILLTGVTIARFGLLMALGVLALTVVTDGRFSMRLLARMLGIASVGLALFLAIGQLREDIGAAGTPASERIRQGAVSLPSKLAVLMWPYLYVVGGFENLDYQLANAPSGAGGKHTFRAVLGPLGGARELAQHTAETGARLPHTKGNFLNTSPYLTDFYFDFGLVGVLLGPAVLGFFASALFVSRLLSPPLLVASSVVLYSLAMTFFSNYFTYPLVPFLIAVLFAIHWLAFAERRVLLEPHSRAHSA